MIKNLTRFRTPAINWVKIKNKILPEAYELDMVFVNDKFIAGLNAKYRRKSGPTNVLAFKLDRLTGQIFIDLPRALSQAADFGIKPKNYILYLYIHGLLHLNGYGHKTSRQSNIMEQKERKWLKALS